jgi:hypothetical protein
MAGIPSGPGAFRLPMKLRAATTSSLNSLPCHTWGHSIKELLGVIGTIRSEKVLKTISDKSLLLYFTLHLAPIILL